MKIWIVNHPYRYRRWLKIKARLLGQDGWHAGFIWSEWFGEHDEEEFHVPRVPAKQLVGANIDPLVIGPHMYFDYCRKRTSNGKNNRERNELERGDLILFGCVNQGDVIIDTVFVVGETKQWGPRGVPTWADLDVLAKRIHFHSDAHEEQHPEVHSADKVWARSYQGEPCSNRSPFCWVPFRNEAPSATARPLMVPQRSRPYTLLAEVFGRTLDLESGMMASFPVVEESAARGAALFTALRNEARRQGFKIAIEMRLLSGDPEARIGSIEGSCAAPPGAVHVPGPDAKSLGNGPG